LGFGTRWNQSECLQNARLARQAQPVQVLAGLDGVGFFILLVLRLDYQFYQKTLEVGWLAQIRFLLER